MSKFLDIGLFVGTLGLFVFATLSVCLRGLVTLNIIVELMGFLKQKKLSFEELGEILAVGLSVCPSVGLSSRISPFVLFLTRLKLYAFQIYVY